MQVMVEKFGHTTSRKMIEADHCPACEFARAALRNEGDVIFVLVHHEDWGLRRVECLIGGPVVVVACDDVTERDARKEIAERAAS